MRRMEHVLVGGLDCNVFWPNRNRQDETGEWDLVIVLHMRLGSKDQFNDTACKAICDAGFVCVIFDAPNHGIRMIQGMEHRNQAWNEKNYTHATDMYAQMIQTVKEIGIVIDFLPASVEENQGRKVTGWSSVSVVGFSQGGHAALLALTNEPRVDVCVSVISSGDYLLNMQVRYEKLVERVERKKLENPPPFHVLVPDSLTRVLDRYDPIRNVSRIAQNCRPLLMINGGDDTLVPIECNRKLFGELKRLYENQGKARAIEHIEMPGVKHEVLPEMISQAVEWLQKWTKQGRNKL